MDSTDLQKGVTSLYEERKKFIVIGLTGRTGSGCTTAAEILSKEIVEIQPPKPHVGEVLTNEDRKYRILYEYAQKNLRPFWWIQMRDIITSYIIEARFDDFCDFVARTIACEEGEREYIRTKITEELEEEYEKYFEKRQYIKGLLENSEKDVEKKSRSAVDFYTKDLPAFTSFLKGKLDVIGHHSYTKTYQLAGDNIRSSGTAISDRFDPKNISAISRRTNKLIKAIRCLARKEKREAFVVIDALRNPYEALFFKDRYSAFYLVAVNTPDNVRQERLKNKLDISPSQVQELDEKEYTGKLQGQKIFISQNIKKCIELADIHLHNPQLGESDTSYLKRQLVWYISLIMHPGLVTPTAVERSMQIAYTAKLNSGCISRQVGAAVTDENFAIKVVGWNSVPEGQVACLLRSLNDLSKHDDKVAFSSYELNNRKFRVLVEDIVKRNESEEVAERLQGRNISFCFKDFQNGVDKKENQVHTRALHAEENAFLQLAKYGGQGIAGGYLFTTASPCELCSKKAYQLGIRKIYYIDPYPGIAEPHVLKVGSKQPALELFSGAIGRAYNQLYQPIIPYKDELNMLIDMKMPARDKCEEERKQLTEEVERLKKEVETLKGVCGSI